ncbi:hypothetical protein [Listeria seeligeri]|uniref:hypothetical protein n=1 Tax=Listeria seeligeri TaxID=1640 RepID=UPI0016292681|nr:hypothetical protein [Listeria seeligeri]MBC1737580.1 hypothetical protein [Listeria seeligeri]
MKELILNILGTEIFNTIVAGIISASVTIIGVRMTIKHEKKIRKEEEIKQNQPLLKIDVEDSKEEFTNCKSVILMYTPFGVGFENGDSSKVDHIKFNSLKFILIKIKNISLVPCSYINLARVDVEREIGVIDFDMSANMIGPNDEIKFQIPVYHPKVLPKDSQYQIYEEIPDKYKMNIGLIYADKNGVFYNQYIQIDLVYTLDTIYVDERVVAKEIKMLTYKVKFPIQSAETNILDSEKNNFSVDTSFN